jgi:DNA segregation ATPase FtsK/SpoIIIE, S-DNA-T family
VNPGPPPLPPAEVEALRFPLIPLLVPVVMAIVMAIVFSSALALMMGALGPLMVFGGWWEQVRNARTRAATADASYREARAVWEGQRVASELADRAELQRRFPMPTEWIDDPLWRGFPPNTTEVRVGTIWSGGNSAHGSLGLIGPASRPAVIDVTSGLAVVGAQEALGIWRSVVSQWCAVSNKAALTASVLHHPHQVRREICGVSRLVWVSSIEEVPADCVAILVVTDESRGTLTRPGEATVVVRLDTLGLAGLGRAMAKLTPSSSVNHTRSGIDFSARDQLWFSLHPGGEMWDLVKCGPHTVVWGSTGSGKSVTVVTMVSSLLENYRPQNLVVVVIDFKGGAGLKPLEEAPHTVGVVTDLEPGKSTRALLGMRTEMVKREKLLAAHGVSELARLPTTLEVPRLLVVVDEVAWLLTNNPQWSDLLSDVLARGRSLGIHVVLSTQRVSGVLTRAMMANIALRICGRVSDDQELVEWMPGLSKEVAKMATHAKPGEVVLSAGDGEPTLVQVAQVSPPEFSFAPSSWRVWVEDLPLLYPWHRESFGVMECVETQEHTAISYRPEEGSVLVVGDRRSGRSSATSAIASLHPHSLIAPSSSAETWLALETLSGKDRVLVIDDADILLQGSGAEGEAFLLDAIEGFSGTLVLSCQPGHRLSRQLARFAPHAVCLTIAKSDQAVLWGAKPSLLPGRGTWRGSRIQVGFPAPQPDIWRPESHSFDAEKLVVVSEQPEAWAHHNLHQILTLDQFSSQWLSDKTVLLGSDIVWDCIGHRDIRYSTGGKAWIPPLEPPEGARWVTSAGNPILTRPADWPR